MQLLAVSPESEYPNEASLIAHLLDAGLARYHLRKPDWKAVQCAKLLEHVPAGLRQRISIHQHHELAETFGVGVHFKDGMLGGRLQAVVPRWPATAGTPAFSRSLHHLQSIESDTANLQYAFLSPVFASISKSGYAPTWTEAELCDVLSKPRRVQLYALGGIRTANSRRAMDYGFDGVVLHGSLWQSADPFKAFQHFRKEAA